MGWNYGGKCESSPKNEASALRVEGLSCTYPGSESPSLQELNFTIQRGERVALVGPNGAGKSTLIRLVLGLQKADRGIIEIFGHPVARCLHRVAMISQRNEVDWLSPVTVREVVMMGRYVHLGWFRRPTAEDREFVEDAMERMGIADLSNRKLGWLSGGQQQRVMLARTLAHNADLMLLDEPLNHTDISTQELIFHTLEELTEKGKAVVVSTHDLGVLTVHFSRAIFLDRKIVADGAPKDVLIPEIISLAYGFQFHENYKKKPDSADSDG